MNVDKVLKELENIETYADLIKQRLTLLKKELDGSRAPKSSARKGKLSKEQKAALIAKVEKNRMKKATGKSGS